MLQGFVALLTFLCQLRTGDGKTRERAGVGRLEGWKGEIESRIKRI